MAPSSATARTTATQRAASVSHGDRMGILLDLDDGSLRFFKNGVEHGPGYPAGSVTGPVAPAVQMYYLLLSVKKVPSPKSAQTSAPPPPPRVPGAQGGSLDGRGWIYAPGAGWGAHYCQLTALTGPRGVLCVHLGVPV